MITTMNTIPTDYRPTPAHIQEYVNRWYTLENYVNQEHALDKLFFELCPQNKCIEDILIKCSALNDFYSTNIFDVHSVAQHILSLDIDERLKRGDLSLVNDIATTKVGEKRKDRFFYSFATKYCSHHKPDKYAIYDNYVEKVLMHFKNKSKDNFSSFKRPELKDYNIYMKVIADFQSYYGLEGFTIKQLDQYLWQFGKEHFKRDYR